MPYIKQDQRDFITNLMQDYLNANGANNSGQLNFLITIIINKYFEEMGGNYSAINDIIGALEGAKLEFYRRKVAEYEDRKIAENGDLE